MEHTLVHSLAGTRTVRRERRAVDDPLDAMRGIVFGLGLSLLGFWVPVALLLTR